MEPRSLEDEMRLFSVTTLIQESVNVYDMYDVEAPINDVLWI